MYSKFDEDLECITSPDLGPTFPLSGKASVQSLFGIYFTYVNRYLDYSKGRESRGLFAELPFDHSLVTIWEVLPLTLFQELDIQLTGEIRKKFIRALRLVLEYTEQGRVIQIISDILTLELRSKTDRGNQRSASSLDLRWAT